MKQYVEVDNTVKIKKPTDQDPKAKNEGTEQTKTVKILME